MTARPQRVVVVVQRHSVLSGHLGLDVEHVRGRAHDGEVLLGQGLTLPLFLRFGIGRRNCLHVF